MANHWFNFDIGGAFVRLCWGVGVLALAGYVIYLLLKG